MHPPFPISLKIIDVYHNYAPPPHFSNEICIPAVLGCCGVQRIGHWEWWKAKKSRDILKYRELILSWSMRFTLALFSEQCSVLCQNCCHGYHLINHLQIVLDVVSLSFLPQHNHWQSLCLFLNPHKWKCWLAWFKITVKPRICFPVIFTSVKRSPLRSGRNHLLVSLNGLFVLSSTCIEWSLKVELLE